MGELVMSETQLEALSRVLLAERLSCVEANSDCKIAVDVQLSVNARQEQQLKGCLLYTSDAADEMD